jgi:hypothetical protein
MAEVTHTATQTYSDYTANDSLSVFGGEEDMFGAEITRDVLIDPTFKVLFDAELGSGVVSVDDVSVEVFYTIDAGNPELINAEGLNTYGLLSGTIGRGEYGETIFVVVGGQGVIKTSPDGETWTERESGTAFALRGVAAGIHGFIAVGDYGIALYSDYGETWVQEDTLTNEQLLSVAYDLPTNTFTACGANEVIRRRSTDGIWQDVRY